MARTIVLLHDLAESATVWVPVAEGLADMGYSVFAIDFRGPPGTRGCLLCVLQAVHNSSAGGSLI